MEQRRRQSTTLALAFVGAMSILAAVLFLLLLRKLLSGAPECEGPTFGAARLWQFEAEKLALLGIAATLGGGLCALFAMGDPALRRFRGRLGAAVILLGVVLTLFAAVADLTWTPCLNT